MKPVNSTPGAGLKSRKSAVSQVNEGAYSSMLFRRSPSSDVFVFEVEVEVRVDENGVSESRGFV